LLSGLKSLPMPRKPPPTTLKVSLDVATRQLSHDVNQPWEFIVPSQQSPLRLDRFLADALDAEAVSRQKIKTWIKAGLAAVNGHACGDADRLLFGGECVTLEAACTAPSTLAAEAGALNILYRDNDLLVLNKPAGLTVHPAPGLTQGTLVHRLIHHVPELVGLDSQRPGIVHRIDKDTSGLLLVALHEAARLRLAADFAARRIHKEYLALVYGVPATATGTIDLPIGRHPTQKTRMAVLRKGGKPAQTEFQTLYADPRELFSLLRVRIHTGRTHQIRVHLQQLGHGLIGERSYVATPALLAAAAAQAPLLVKLAQRQLLHAWFIRLEHPMRPGATLEFQCAPPKDFLRVFLHLHRRLQRVVATGMPGCGKSSVLERLKAAQYSVFSADEEVAACYAPRADAWNYIVRRFGERFLAPDAAEGTDPLKDQGQRVALQGRQLDRRALFEAMRTCEPLRREIMDIVHPMVRHRLAEFWTRQRLARVAFAEIPLLFEAEQGAWRRSAADLTVGVFSPQRQRQQRLSATRNWTGDIFATMESWQWPEADKIRACDLILDNSGSIDDLERRTSALLHALCFLRRQSIKRTYELYKRLIAYASSGPCPS